MSSRPILRMGHPLLLETAAPVTEFGTSALRGLLEEMLETMQAAGGVGLAAPQVGVSQRIIIFGVERSERYPEVPPVPMTVLINPEFEPLGHETESGWEGCLSLPGLRGLVPRYRRIRYRGWDPHGRHVEREAEGFHARVVQHEVDHLNGILYPMRIEDLRHFGFEEELSGYLAGDSSSTAG